MSKLSYKERSKSWREKNREYDLERKKLWKKLNPDKCAIEKRIKKDKILEIILQDKLKNPCECGELNPEKLIHHHVNPNNKRFCVSKARSFITLEAELLKCKVVCIDCHKKIHKELRQKDITML
jgi:hypothetical protein